MKMEGKWFGKNGALDRESEEREGESSKTGVRDNGGEWRRWPKEKETERRGLKS